MCNLPNLKLNMERGFFLNDFFHYFLLFSSKNSKIDMLTPRRIPFSFLLRPSPRGKM